MGMMHTMNPEVKAKWLEALRSGEYKQTTAGRLCDSTGFCCLGVLTDLCIKEHPEEKGWESAQYGEIYGVKTYRGYIGQLPHDVSNWAHLPKGPNHELVNPLMQRNDEGESFASIADYIERNL